MSVVYAEITKVATALQLDNLLNVVDQKLGSKDVASPTLFIEDEILLGDADGRIKSSGTDLTDLATINYVDTSVNTATNVLSFHGYNNIAGEIITLPTAGAVFTSADGTNGITGIGTPTGCSALALIDDTAAGGTAAVSGSGDKVVTVTPTTMGTLADGDIITLWEATLDVGAGALTLGTYVISGVTETTFNIVVAGATDSDTFTGVKWSRPLQWKIASSFSKKLIMMYTGTMDAGTAADVIKATMVVSTGSALAGEAQFGRALVELQSTNEHNFSGQFILPSIAANYRFALGFSNTAGVNPITIKGLSISGFTIG